MKILKKILLSVVVLIVVLAGAATIFITISVTPRGSGL